MLKLEEIKDEEITILLKECNKSESELKENINSISKIINIIETKKINYSKKKVKNEK